MAKRMSAGRLQRMLAESSPVEDNTYDLGASDRRFANGYFGDLHLANERGDYTLIEEEDCLTIRNNKTGKIYKLVMEEIEAEGSE